MAADGSRVQIDARIIWVASTGDGDYHAGIAFRNLTPDEAYPVDLQLVRSAQ